MPILYRTTAPHTPQVSPYVAMDVQWLGADGTLWLLTDPSSPMRLMPGIRGLEAGPIERWTSDAPGVAGTRYRGHRALPREVFLPVYLRAASSVEWAAVRRSWDAGMSPDDEGVLTVTVAGQRRHLPCRWVSTEPAWTRDPLLAARSAVGEYLEASGAYWQADPISRRWVASAEADFFMPAGSGGVFQITPSNETGTATIANPGDVPAWPVWTVRGPLTSATIGVAAAEIEIPFPLALGEWLQIDTRPDRQAVVDHTGADRVADLGAVSFTPVPKGQSVTLSIDAIGTGTGFDVDVQLTPLYRRAW